MIFFILAIFNFLINVSISYYQKWYTSSLQIGKKTKQNKTKKQPKTTKMKQNDWLTLFLFLLGQTNIFLGFIVMSVTYIFYLYTIIKNSYPSLRKIYSSCSIFLHKVSGAAYLSGGAK